MPTLRKDSTQNYQLRSGRFQFREGEWFLQTREGIELGPFESHAEASTCLNDYLSFVDNASSADLQQFFKIYAAA